jgi:predicted Zn-dependent peptidase
VDRTRLPQQGPEPAFAFPSIRRRQLGNGLSIAAVERRGLPIVSLALVLPAGSAVDPPDRPGLASLAADMLDEGSGDRSAVGIQEALSRIGTELDTEVGPDSAVLSLSLLDRFVPEALRLLADIAVRPRLDLPDLERVRTLRLNRIRQLRDVPGVNAEVVFAREIFGAHPYGHLTIGTSAALGVTEQADVTAFHRRHYAPGSGMLVAAGSLDLDSFARHAEDAFGGWAATGEDGPPGPADAPPPPPVSAAAEPARRLFIVDRPGAAQTELRVGHLGVPRHTPDFHALVLLNAILGGHFSSRLNLNLRERRGFTYGVRSVVDFRKAAGPFSVQTSVQTDATAEAVGEILGELRAITADRPPGDDERGLSEATLTKGYPRNFETPGQVARGVAQMAIYDLPDDTFAVFGPRIRALTAADVARAAAEHLHPDRSIVVAVGDGSRIRAGLERLGLGEAAVVDAGL